MLLSYFHWHPPITFTPFFENPRENLAQLIWPALAVGYRYSAVATRMMRSTLLEVLQEDYIRTARAKGVYERLVVVRHALSNAMLPVVTVIGLEFAFLIGGLVVTEQVFNLNGIGKLFVQAVSRSDFTMVQALVLLVAAFFIVVNFVIDLMYAWLDPRIRYRLMSAVPGTLEITYKVPRRRHPVLAFAVQQPLGTAGLAIIVLMLVAAAFAKWVAPYDPLAVDYGGILAPPSWKHLLGTDNFGRDVFSRIIYGSQTALAVGFLSSLIGCTLGAIIGVASAYFGGRTDMIVQRFMDVILAFPIIVLALAVVAVLGKNVVFGIDWNLIIAIGLPMVPRVARVVRSSALAVREMPYIDAARTAGFSHARIIFRHIVPNVVAPYLIMLTASVGQAILLEASLSFLGLGVTEPTPAWGLMLSGSAIDFYQQAPWMIVFPGVAISLAVFAFNLFGDSLRDWLDPKIKI